MNKFKSIALLFGLLISSLAFTSCESNNEPNDTITEQSFLRCYAVVNDTHINDLAGMTINKSAVIKLTLNWSKSTAKVEMTGITIGGMPYPMITITDLPWKIDNDGWSEISVSNTTADTATGMPITIKNFELEWLDRLDFAEVVGSYDPALEFSFVVDNRYTVSGSRAPVVVTGTTISAASPEDSFTNLNSVYFASFDFDQKLANINILNAQFAKGMPALNIDFTKMPMSIDTEGVITIECASLIPEMNNTPQPSFPITDLKAKIVPGDGMDLEFACDFRGTKYNVKADLDFTSYTNVIDK